MKKTMVKLLFILFTSIQLIGNNQSSFSQIISESDKSAISGILKSQELNWNDGNLEGYMAGYYKSDSLKFITKKGVTYGWENTLLMYQKSYPDKASMGKLQFEITNIETLCEQKALMTGKWTLHITGENNQIKEVSGYFTLIWQKFEGKWFIIVDHTS